MAPSPSSAEHARVIRELARDLQSSPRSLPSPSPSPIGRDPIDESYHSLPQSSAFEPTQEGLVSTQQLDETTKGHLLRSSARRFGYYNPPAPAPHVNTSMVAKEFVDFDQEGHSEDSLSVEFARGAKRSLHSTPAKGRPLADVSGNSLFNLEQDSLYDVTPPSLSRKSIRKSLGVPSSLRRDAQIRRASSAPQNELVGNATNGDRRRSTLQQMHSKVASEEDVSFNEERPPTVTATFKSTRFSNARRVSSNHNTPQKQTSGTPRSAPATGNGTQQSFMLPDLPNLTELVSGVFQDGTPVFSKTAKARSRFFSAPNAGRFPSSKANYPPIDRIPIPSEEKALFTSLQLLKEKVTQLEKDKAAAEKTIEEQAVEIAKLRMTNQTRSPTFEANAPAHWKSEKSKLELSVATLTARLNRAERKLSVNDLAQKRVTTDRDGLYQQLSTAFLTSEELKDENVALQNENNMLRDEVDILRVENEALRNDLELSRGNLGQRFSDRNLAKSLGDEAYAARNQQDKEAQRVSRKEKAERSKLKAENEALRLQLANAEAHRAEEEQYWLQREGELRAQVHAKDETIHRFEDLTPGEMNKAIREDNERLRVELVQLSTQLENDQQRWAEKETRLRRRIEKREDAMRMQQGLLEPTVTSRPNTIARSSSKRPSTHLHETQTTQSRIADQVDHEVRKSRSTATSQRQSTHVSRSRSRIRPAESMRSVSAPITNMHDAEMPNVDDSTTDISVGLRRKKSGTQMDNNTGAYTITQSQSMDLTQLSFMGQDEIAKIRRTIEEERAAKRTNPTAQNDTIRSNLSVKLAQVLPRKSSLKDTTSRFQMAETDVSKQSGTQKDATQQQTDLSIYSNSSRRRRSAPVEMTSAFIIPDITVRIPGTSQHVHVGDHDMKNCTICHRNANGSSTGAVSSQQAFSIPEPVPVSSREDLGPDATLRPAQSPQDALAQVLKELEDELAHLKLELSAQESLLQSHEPSLGKRQRKAIQARIIELLKTIDIKFDQIYALYDVLEGQKADGLLDREDNGTKKKRQQLSEQQIDDTLRSVGLDPQEARKGKRVTINEGDDDSDDNSLPSVNDFDDGELPWEGISDTESVVGRV